MRIVVPIEVDAILVLPQAELPTLYTLPRHRVRIQDHTHLVLIQDTGVSSTPRVVAQVTEEVKARLWADELTWVLPK